MFCTPRNNPPHQCKENTTRCLCSWVGPHALSKWPLGTYQISKNFNGSHQLSLLVSLKAKFSLHVEVMASLAKGGNLWALDSASWARWWWPFCRWDYWKLPLCGFLQGVRALYNGKVRGRWKPTSQKIYTKLGWGGGVSPLEQTGKNTPTTEISFPDKSVTGELSLHGTPSSHNVHIYGGASIAFHGKIVFFK